MLKMLRTTALTVAALAAASITATPQRAEAQTYQIDCAILLCLSGGWPASVPCARARAEFIRRITPWPVEPPLQIWRCPMGAAYTVDPDTLTSERIYEILFELDQSAPLQSFPVDEAGTPFTGLDGRGGTTAGQLILEFSFNLDLHRYSFQHVVVHWIFCPLIP